MGTGRRLRLRFIVVDDDMAILIVQEFLVNELCYCECCCLHRWIRSSDGFPDPRVAKIMQSWMMLRFFEVKCVVSKKN